MDIKDYLRLMRTDALSGYEPYLYERLIAILTMTAEIAPEQEIRDAERDFFDGLWDFLEDDAEAYSRRYLDEDWAYEDREDKRRMRREHERERARSINDGV